MPRPTARTITVKPMVTPSMCARVLLKPKFTPDASSIVLFGPGVMAPTKANTISDRTRSWDICDRQRGLFACPPRRDA
ncbi:hypothetical protein D9M70_600390 [compost metagenome]